MDFYSVEYWQENWDALLERVENGETIGIENTETGERAVMIPADDELLRIYTENNNEAS
jgi:ribosome assembly protein YihI (activator of Der GTPase)